MKPSKTSKQWLREHISDPFVHRAQKEGYRARAAYKLLELDERDHLLRPGLVIVDLGAAPGSWCQVVSRKLGGLAEIIALDLLPMQPVPGVRFIQGDFREDRVLRQLEAVLAGKNIDLVISDMAPNMSGVAAMDQARAMGLAELALEFALAHLKPGGDFVTKVFQGAGLPEFVNNLRPHFQKVNVRKPKASRDRSSEQFVVAKGKLPDALA